MPLKAADLTRMSRLLDEALPLDAAGRQAWLDGLPADHQDLAAALRNALLTEGGEIRQQASLTGLPDLGPSIEAALSENNSGLTAASIIGPYRLVRELGRGGMGSVWLAERTDGTLKRQIALKLPHSSLPQRQLAERFGRERDILAGLNHPHIARLYDAGVTEEGRPYLALEFVDGEPLNTYCDGHRLGIKARLELFLQVLSALQYAHNQLVVHRDLKPSNILVTPAGEVKLLDFGIAKLLTDGAAHETELTQMGGRALTPQYASPEQILGQPIGTASDVYALGVVLYELLTGSLPYRLKRDSRGALEDAILSADAPRPSKTEVVLGNAQARDSTVRKLVTLLRGDLDTIVLKALKKNAAERYATAQLFADDLRRYLAGEAVLAQPDSTWYRTGKFVRRNWLAVGAAAAVVVALTVGLGVALWQAQVARTSESHARSEARTAKAVQAFLMDIFQANSSNQADPQKARNTTARALLDKGADKIDSAMADAPAAKLEILKTLGQLYIEIGLNKQSAALQRKRVELARAVFGAQSSETVEALLDLAQVLSKQLDDPDWEKSLKEAQAILDAQGSGDTRAKASLYRGWSNFYTEHDLAKATEFGERALSIYRILPPDRDFVAALAAAASAYANRGEWLKASTSLKEAIAAASGPASSSSADLLPALYDSLAEAAVWLDNLAEAESDIRFAWEQSKSLNGENDVVTLGYLAEYASLLVNNGPAADGIEKLRQAMAKFRTSNGADEPARLSAFLDTYGDSLSHYGHLEEGLKAMTEARTLVARGGDSLRVAMLMGEEAYILVNLGRIGEATRLLDSARALLSKSGEPDTAWTRFDEATRLNIFIAQGRVAEANRQAAKLFATPTTSVRRERSDVVAKERLALLNGQPQVALDLAQKAIAKIEGDANRKYLGYYLYWSYHFGGKALRIMKQPQQAEAMLRKALAITAPLFDQSMNPDVADTLVALAECMADLDRREEARTLAAKAHVIHAAHKELGLYYREPLRALDARLAKLD